MNKGEFRKNLFEKGAVLDPIECSSEVRFGLCMKLTIKGVMRVFKRLDTAINFTAMALLFVAVTIALRG